MHGVIPREKAEGDAVEHCRRMRLPNLEEIGFCYPHQLGSRVEPLDAAQAIGVPEYELMRFPSTDDKNLAQHRLARDKMENFGPRQQAGKVPG